ncbi:helix-turn-helix domain-containing protein [Streptomyces sparsogenes]|uniref:helix-turn-helix domain-containing protein n=1 Tax=Streptomyces sparsogenes TaxID=67365 RepID=UPI0033F7002F
MAEQQLSARPRARSVVSRSAGGVTQISDYQPRRYTIIGDHLTQHRDLSLTAIGLGTHIQSLPDGAAVDIRTLSGKFAEGRERIAAALRELEDHGYIKRIRERTPEGRIVTRTLSYNVPRTADDGHAAEPAPEPAAEEPTPPKRERAARPPATTPPPPPPTSDTTPTPPPARPHRPTPPPLPEPTAPAPERHRTAAALLAELRRDDARLLLAERDVRRLAAEQVGSGGIAPVVRKQLDRHPPSDHSVTALPHLAHTATADEPHQLVTPGQNPRHHSCPPRAVTSAAGAAGMSLLPRTSRSVAWSPAGTARACRMSEA